MILSDLAPTYKSVKMAPETARSFFKRITHTQHTHSTRTRAHVYMRVHIVPLLLLARIAEADLSGLSGLGLRLRPDVEAALDAGKPVVALESTIISHGMPFPQNLETAREVEKIVRDGGAVGAREASVSFFV